MDHITDRAGHPRSALTGALAAALLTVGLLAPGAGAATLEASPGASPAGSLFTSTQLEYTIQLPPGWSVVAASQEAGRGEDLFQSADASARVGGGPVDDDTQTVADRVTVNRAEVTATGSCSSDPSLDRASTLGGEEAILWSWTCPGSHHVAVNTIHDDVRLRLQVNVAEEASAGAEPLLDLLRQSFRFTGGPTTSPDPDVLADLDAALQGTWVNAWHPVELEFATLEARGLDDHGDRGWWDYMEAGTTAQSAVRFRDGEIVQYGAVDGGPLEVGWIGTYRLLDDHTIEAIETSTFNHIVYEFTLQDDVLTMDVIANADPVDLIPQTAIYETLPFTRVP